MKKIISGLLALIMVSMAMVPANAEANEGLSYSVSQDGTSCVINGSNKSIVGKLEIPEKIDGYEVTAIDVAAFYGCNSLSEIVIPEGTTSIGEAAFFLCSSLNKIEIPESMRSIGDGAFYDCTSLTDISISENVNYIGEDAFGGCTLLENINIPEGITNIARGTFCATSLASVDIPDGVLSIGEYAFQVCKKLTKVVLPLSVTQIDAEAFEGCEALSDIYYAGSEEDKNKIEIAEGNEELLNVTWHYNSIDEDEQKFTVGRDDFSFLNEAAYFKTGKSEKERVLNALAQLFFRKSSSIYEKTDYQMQKEDFEKLTNGMSNVVKNEIVEDEAKEWQGSCFGMARVAVIRYLAKERLPLSAIDNALSDENVTFDLKAPVEDENVKRLINYYQLMQDLPKEEKITSECEKRIREDYLGAIQDIVTAIKSEGCVQVSISQSKAKGAHAVLLVGINKETEDFVDAQVWDPNQVEIKSLYMYIDKGDAKDSIRISTEVYGDKFDQLYRWFSGIDNIDTRNYFGMDDHQEAKDYDKARIKIRSDMSLSFSSGDVSLNIVNGKIESDRNVSGPYYSEIDDENGEGEIKFSIEKQYLGNEAICTASGKNSINELTIINDGWSVSIVSDKPIQISMDNTEQSVKIQSEEKGLLSAWLTQNTPSANSAWYGTAVDVNDAKELILTPTSEGVKVNSDNMQDARVTVNGDGTFASKAINTTKNEILVQEDADATIGDCIKIQGTYTIRASVGLHGTISPAGYVAVDAGGTQTFTFTPDEGYTVEHVKVNGKNKGEITDYTFKKVKKDQEIEVTFREKTEQDSEPKEKSGYGPILDWILSIIEWIKHWFQA